MKPWKLFTPMEGSIPVKQGIDRGSVLLAIILLACLASIGCAGFSSANTTPPPPSLTITGTISPTTGGSGVTLTLSGAGSSTTTSDDSGNYSFGSLSNGSYLITPSKTGYSFNPANQTVVIITAGATNVNFTASQSTTPPPTYSITGTISPSTFGTGVTVALGGAATATTTTDSLGNYSFASLDSGSYTITPSKSGISFTPSSLSATINGANVTGQNFTAIQNTYSFSGTISPAAIGSGVSITLSGAASATTTADSSGNYSFTGLLPGSYSATPSKTGYTFTPGVRSATISNGNATGENFTVAQTTYSFSGTISPAPGGSGATVTLSGAASTTTTADSSGNYSFTGLLPGSYTATPSKTGYTFSPGVRSATITNASVTGENFTASQNSYSFSGTISPAGYGSGATVTLSGAASATTTADSSGNYSFTGLLSGSYSATPSKTGFTFSPGVRSATITNANATGENFTASQSVTPTYSISGTVSPAANGAGVTVALGGAASATTTTNSSGNYSFSGLASGSYTITPSKQGYTFSPSLQSVTITNANVAGENFTATAIISTPAGLMISGTISPITNGRGVTVTLSGSASASTTTDNSGNYSFAGLGSGSYTITPSQSGFEFSPVSQTVTLNSTSATQVNFAVYSQTSVINISPGQDIAAAVAASPAGSTFLIAPGTYRLNNSIIPKNGDTFIGKTTCAPPATSCPVIISGSTVIGPSAGFNGTNYVVTGQTQQNPIGTTTTNCDPGWLACIYPEDLYFDGVPYKHLYSPSLPTIKSGEWWFDYANQIIYFHDNPAGHTVETSVLPNAFGGPANYVTIQFVTVKEFATMYPIGAIGQSQFANGLTQETNWTVQYCELLLNHGFGVKPGYKGRVVNNYVHNNGQMGVGVGLGNISNPTTQSTSSGILVQNNLITHNDYAHFNPNFGSGGIKIGSTAGVTIRGNTIQYNEGSGVHFDDYSTNELLDDNIITDNTDSDGVNQEIGYGVSIFRNNLVLRNGTPLNDNYNANQIAVHASAGVDAYCNVMEVSVGANINPWVVGASNRGYSGYPPYQYLVTSGNSFHHNSVLWDAGAGGGAGFLQNDSGNQPNFFANNPAPDYNTYHLANSGSATHFTYDNNNSGIDQPINFAQFQANGADIHGTADSNFSSGYPTLEITSPMDQSSFTGSVPVAATASDASGISKVEFYFDWALQATVNAAPYEFTMSGAGVGTHTVAAMAYSNAGIRSCYAITLNEQ